MRLFIACEPDAAFLSVLTQAQRAVCSAADCRPTKRENLHITLAFLGEQSNITAIKAAIDAVDMPAFDISSGRVGYFGENCCLFLEGGLASLAGSLRAGLDKRGIAYDTKPFKAHITLARAVRQKVQGIAVPKTVMRVRNITLFSSVLTPSGPVYRRLYVKNLNE